jgi:hypothetical protein
MKKMILYVSLVLVFCFFVSDENLFAQTSTEANPFLGKWQGEWANIRGRLEVKGELVIKESGTLEFVFGNDPMYEFPYTITNSVLSFISSSGKIRVFKILEDGTLKGELKNPSAGMNTWVCWMKKVP